MEATALAWLHGLASEAAPLFARYGYPALFLAMLAEGCLVPAPGLTLLLAGALAAASGAADIWTVIATGLLGTLAGSFAGYALGRVGGRPLLARIGIGPGRLAPLEQQFARWGPWLVLVGRFPDGLRQLNAPLAGVLGMPLPAFAAANLGGALIWVGLFAGGVWLADERAAVLARWAHRAAPWLLAAAVALAAWLGWRRLRANR